MVGRHSTRVGDTGYKDPGIKTCEVNPKMEGFPLGPENAGGEAKRLEQLAGAQ